MSDNEPMMEPQAPNDQVSKQPILNPNDMEFLKRCQNYADN